MIQLANPQFYFEKFYFTYIYIDIENCTAQN